MEKEEAWGQDGEATRAEETVVKAAEAPEAEAEETRITTGRLVRER